MLKLHNMFQTEDTLFSHYRYKSYFKMTNEVSIKPVCVDEAGSMIN